MSRIIKTVKELEKKTDISFLTKTLQNQIFMQKNHITPQKFPDNAFVIENVIIREMLLNERYFILFLNMCLSSNRCFREIFDFFFIILK